MNFDLSKYLQHIDSQTIGKNIYYVQETESTNDAIWDYYNDEEYLILVTDDQTGGRGRRDNKWFSEPFNSLIFSIAIIDDKKNSSLISLKAGIAISIAINKISNLDVKTKWPNDIMINKKKSWRWVPPKIEQKNTDVRNKCKKKRGRPPRTSFI